MPFFNEEISKQLDAGGSSFYELQSGSNEFRIVSEFAWGYRHDYQHREEGKELDHPFYRLDDPYVGKNQHKLVLTAAMVVYDYESGELKPFTLHQKNILNVIRDYSNNEKYGNPTDYDLVVTKKGEGRETRYSVIANPPEMFSKEIEAALKDVNINVDNFYEGKPMIES